MIVQLDDKQRQLLPKRQKTESAKRDYVKITVILMIDQGVEPHQIALAVGIDQSSMRLTLWR